MNGYNKEEVDRYISLLKKDYETRLAEQKDRIFSLKNELENAQKGDTLEELVSVVEKAKQIESSSKSIYELEFKKINLIYRRLDNIISQLMNNVPDQAGMLSSQLGSLKQTIEATLSTEFVVPDSTDPVRKLLAKMASNQTVYNVPIQKLYDKKQVERSTQEDAEHIAVEPKAIVTSATISAPRQDKIVRKAKVDKPAIFENLLQDDVGENYFEKVMFNGTKPKSVITSPLSYPTPNESGFDLKEAVNPKEDLNEIMKAFDFFNSDDE